MLLVDVEVNESPKLSRHIAKIVSKLEDEDASMDATQERQNDLGWAATRRVRPSRWCHQPPPCDAVAKGAKGGRTSTE